MYGGGGVDAAFVTDDVTFDDPAASYRGKAEVSEAFRALHVARPEHVEEPLVISESEVYGEHEFYLHSRYLRGTMLPSFEVRSILVVRTGADGRICAFEERWNGAPLLQLSAFRWVRRVNGVVSSLLTPRVA